MFLNHASLATLVLRTFECRKKKKIQYSFWFSIKQLPLSILSIFSQKSFDVYTIQWIYIYSSLFFNAHHCYYTIYIFSFKFGIRWIFWVYSWVKYILRILLDAQRMMCMFLCNFLFLSIYYIVESLELSIKPLISITDCLKVAVKMNVL